MWSISWADIAADNKHERISSRSAILGEFSIDDMFSCGEFETHITRNHFLQSFYILFDFLNQQKQTYTDLAQMSTNTAANDAKKQQENVDESGYESDTEEYVPEEETNPIKLKNNETMEQLQER